MLFGRYLFDFDVRVLYKAFMQQISKSKLTTYGKMPDVSVVIKHSQSTALWSINPIHAGNSKTRSGREDGIRPPLNSTPLYPNYTKFAVSKYNHMTSPCAKFQVFWLKNELFLSPIYGYFDVLSL